jgi:hypothetical protein
MIDLEEGGMSLGHDVSKETQCGLGRVSILILIAEM